MKSSIDSSRPDAGERALNPGEVPDVRFRAIGVVAKVFGVKGEVKVHSYSRTSSQFEKLGSVHVGADVQRAVTMTIERVVPRGDGVYVKFQGIDDRNAAALLVGQFLLVEDSRQKPLSAGEYFVDDIVGLVVLDPGQRRLGVVTEVVPYPAHDIYVVKAGRTDVMVPAVKEIIRSVDMKSGTMIIDPPEGLFEEPA